MLETIICLVIGILALAFMLIKSRLSEKDIVKLMVQQQIELHKTQIDLDAKSTINSSMVAENVRMVEDAKLVRLDTTRIIEETKTMVAESSKMSVDVEIMQVENATMSAIIEKLGKDLEEEVGKYSALLSQKKSSEVRVGNIAESMAPFLKDFPYNPDVCRFLGMPIDYVVFDLNSEWITFLEVKSGKSQLTTKQRKIKELVDAGKVKFDLYRIEG